MKTVKILIIKSIVLSLLFVLSAGFAFTQSDFKTIKPISISYFGHYGLHPGIKVGTQCDWRSWEKRKERAKGVKVKSRSLFLSPQLGYYVHPGNHSGVLLNTEFGYQRLKPKRGFYQAISLGIGYMTQFNAGLTYEKESDGTFKTKSLASKGYFMPTLNYGFGQAVTPKIGWFGKFTLGSKLGYNTGVSAETFIELGLKLNLGQVKAEK